MKNYKLIVAELERKIDQLKGEGFNIDPLDDLLESLKKHVTDVSEVEEHIDVIKSVVLSPIQKELEENKLAGKFSIKGFYVGMAGLLISVGSLLYTSFISLPRSQSSPEAFVSSNGDYIEPDMSLHEKIDEIRKELIFSGDKVTLTKDIHKIRQFDSLVLLENDGNKLEVKLFAVRETKVIDGDSLFQVAVLNIAYGGRQVTHKGVPHIIKVESKYKMPDRDETYFRVAKGDVLILFEEYRFLVDEVLNTDATTGALGDKETAILFKSIDAPEVPVAPSAELD